MNKVIDKGFRSCRFVSTIVKHPVYDFSRWFSYALEVIGLMPGPLIVSARPKN